MLRFQQYVELIREATPAKKIEAMAHAKKHLIPYNTQYPKEVQQACGLLAIPPRSPTAMSVPAYRELYAPRWEELAALFTKTHNALLALPDTPLLHIALSSGLSALKTPACHASTTNSATGGAASRGVCPICSAELNELASHVPYAHHTKSHVQSDLVMLPSGRTRGKQALLDEARKLGLEDGWVRDPLGEEGEEDVHIDALKKVYIT